MYPSCNIDQDNWICKDEYIVETQRNEEKRWVKIIIQPMIQNQRNVKKITWIMALFGLLLPVRPIINGHEKTWKRFILT